MTRFAWLAAALCMAPSTLAAQGTLSLDQAVRETLTANVSLEAARAARGIAQAQADAAQSGFFPRISVSEAWQRGNQPVFVFGSLLSSRTFGAPNFAIDTLNHPDATNFFHTTFGVEQVIFDGRQRATTAAAGLQRDLASLSADQLAADLALTATRAFGQILIAQAAERAAEAGLASAREDLAHAEHRRDAGMLTDADVLTLAVHVADLEQRRIQADGDLAVARAELNRLMNQPVDREFIAGEPAPADRLDTPNLATLLSEAAQGRPELRRAAVAEQLADAGGREAKSSLLPRVAAQAAFDLSGNRFGDRATGWLVGGGLQWSVSTGGAERAQMRAATGAGLQARAQAEAVRQAVDVEVVTALRQLQTARARQSAGRAAVAQAAEAQRIVRDRFEAGLASVNDVLRASLSTLDAETRRVSVLVDAITSDAMLRRAIGRAPQQAPEVKSEK